MHDPANWSFDTRQIHAGAKADPTTGAPATPICETTSFALGHTEHAENLFAPAEMGSISTRIMIPTTDEDVEDLLADLEAGYRAAKGA